jgi:hypothetical protein
MAQGSVPILHSLQSMMQQKCGELQEFCTFHERRANDLLVLLENREAEVRKLSQSLEDHNKEIEKL